MCLQGSLHTARWISQLENSEFECHLFDCVQAEVHPLVRGVTLHSLYPVRNIERQFVLQSRFPFSKGFHFLRKKLPAIWDRLVKDSLRRIVETIKPDCIHSLELHRQAAYVYWVRKRIQGSSWPPWIYSSWGNDIYYYGRFPNRTDTIRNVLAECDFLTADCQRDINLARQFGFRGTDFGVIPGPGGFPVEEFRRMGVRDRTSHRRLILIKGYQDYRGRAVNALTALLAVGDALKDYDIAVYACHPETITAATRISDQLKKNIRVIGHTSHAEFLKLMAEARVHLAVNASDGTPNTMLEAMIMGAFPVQSDTGSTAEWIEDGHNGLLVRFDDIDGISKAIRRALIDDEMVDRAAELNLKLMREKVDISVVRPRVLDMYRQVIGSS